MEFQIGSVFIKFVGRVSNGKIGHMVLVVPISKDKMLAVRAQITEDDMPFSSDQAIYNRDSKFASEMVRGWLADA